MKYFKNIYIDDYFVVEKELMMPLAFPSAPGLVRDVGRAFG